ncbi:MAG: HDOD domain-containing protein [Bryobacterales bacterium]|nr:HDOD domain-containing protein [Bryobacterales bacterium]
MTNRQETGTKERMEKLNSIPKYPWALRQLPPFPPVANRLLGLLQDQNVSNAQLSEVIRIDPTFSFELLRLANSSLFGFAQQVSDIGHAISIVGLERVKALVMMVALNAQIKSALRYQRLLDCWIHCLACAVLTESVAHGCGIPAERAYMAGLLHDVGRLGMMTAYPQEYARLLDVATEEGLPLIQAELDVFDIDHCMAGAWLAAEWNLPPEVRFVAQTHHEPPEAGDRELGNLLRITNRLTNLIGFSVMPEPDIYSFEDLVDMLPPSARRRIEPSQTALKQEILEKVSVFAAPRAA